MVTNRDFFAGDIAIHLKLAVLKQEFGSPLSVYVNTVALQVSEAQAKTAT